MKISKWSSLTIETTWTMCVTIVGASSISCWNQCSHNYSGKVNESHRYLFLFESNVAKWTWEVRSVNKICNVYNNFYFSRYYSTNESMENRLIPIFQGATTQHVYPPPTKVHQDMILKCQQLNWEGNGQILLLGRLHYPTLDGWESCKNLQSMIYSWGGIPFHPLQNKLCCNFV